MWLRLDAAPGPMKAVIFHAVSWKFGPRPYILHYFYTLQVYKIESFMVTSLRFSAKYIIKIGHFISTYQPFHVSL